MPLKAQRDKCRKKAISRLHMQMLSEFRSSQDTMRKTSTTSARAPEASYVVSLLPAKAKKPLAGAEDLLLPAAVVLAETTLDSNAAERN